MLVTHQHPRRCRATPASPPAPTGGRYGPQQEVSLTEVRERWACRPPSPFPSCRFLAAECWALCRGETSSRGRRPSSQDCLQQPPGLGPVFRGLLPLCAQRRGSPAARLRGPARAQGRLPRAVVLLCQGASAPLCLPLPSRLLEGRKRSLALPILKRTRETSPAGGRSRGEAPCREIGSERHKDLAAAVGVGPLGGKVDAGTTQIRAGARWCCCLQDGACRVNPTGLQIWLVEGMVDTVIPSVVLYCRAA